MIFSEKEKLLSELKTMFEIFVLMVKPDQKDKIINFLEAKRKIHEILANDR